MKRKNSFRLALRAMPAGAMLAASLAWADTPATDGAATRASATPPVNAAAPPRPAGEQPASGANGATAADQACRADGAWDAACIRRAYQGPPASWPRPQIDEGVAWQELSPVPAADADPAAWTAANAGQAQLVRDLRQPGIAALGAMLFFDPRLSRGGQVSCATCHQPQRAFSDGRPLAIGEDGLMGRRRAMPLYAAPFAPSLFWDGRAATLALQALAPIGDSREMNHSVDDAVERLRALPPYPELFVQAYGPSAAADPDTRKRPSAAVTANAPPATDTANAADTLPATDSANAAAEAVDADRLSRALAAYVATLRPPATRFDAFLAGERDALSDQEMVGLHLFRTQARCLNCHNGPLLTDQRFHDIGLSFLGRRNQDLGRYEITRDPADLGTFRTPSLRGVSQAGPWMHNGLFGNLEGLLRLYNVGMGNIPAPPPGSALTPGKSPLIRQLGLNAEEINALVAFLNAL